ncbi:SCO family protein [Skermanella mucosa]|uniref:SCO family protein n=1 Tax=Skermanella mucosa TaxID=1789672 RepID=UPI00192C80E6|nr:SCO family protein [Skermanella mucosa]UEM23722.1 SCO family protein [Skermanella mucosa]
MRTITLPRGAGRAAVLAGLLMGGAALLLGTAPLSARAEGGHAGHSERGHSERGHSEPGHSEPAQTEPAKADAAPAAAGHGGYGAHSGWPEPKKLGGDFSLTDHTGRKVTLADFKGRATAFYFGYTQCDDICPIIGTKLGMAVDLMGEMGDQVNIAMISVDDRNDGPEQLATFVAKQHPRLIGLSGNRREIYEVAAKYRVRRDYVMQNQVAKEGDEPAGEHAGGHGAHGNGDHGNGDHGQEQHEATPISAEATSEETTEGPRTPGQRIRIRSASDDATRLHNMAMAHTTHIYLLNKEGQVVRYIYPSMSPEQLAKRLTDLINEG